VESNSASRPTVGTEDAEYNSAPSRVGLLPPCDDLLRKPLGAGVWGTHGDLVEVNPGDEPVTRPWRSYLPLVWHDDR